VAGNGPFKKEVGMQKRIKNKKELWLTGGTLKQLTELKQACIISEIIHHAF